MGREGRRRKEEGGGKEGEVRRSGEGGGEEEGEVGEEWEGERRQKEGKVGG